MRLLTHNMLACNIKGVTKGFPLTIDAQKLETKDADFNEDFLRSMFTKLDWKALHDAAVMVGLKDIPEQVEPAMLEDQDFLHKFHQPAMLEDHDFLHKFHHALLEVHVEEGASICPETGRRFPVTKGVPNMLLHEDEV